MKKIILTFLFICPPCAGFAAVGCDLNDPDRDVKRFFENSTGYTTAYKTLDKADLPEVEAKLGDKFSGIYETADVPYTVYTVYNKKDIIGYIHGINQKGKYGGLQVFLVYNTRGEVVNFYYQKLTSKKAKAMRSADFAARFKGLTLENFAGKSALIKNPAPEDDTDFKATLRAVKKNLILTDKFVFKERQ
jgi:hypothetical protein